MIWKTSHREFHLSRRALVLGVLNVTPDSFTDGGRFLSVDDAVGHAVSMVDAGASILDVGGESTRPGALPVSLGEELSRVLPVLRAIRERCPGAVLSIDTSKPEVAEAALAAGAQIVNDVTGFRDPDMLRVAATAGAGVVVMHMRGTPRDMQAAPEYTDVVREVADFFRLRYEECLKWNIRPETVIFDPGIGFGKTLEHNVALLCNLKHLRIHERPLMLGVSLKSFIGHLLGEDGIAARYWPTVALTAFLRAGCDTRSGCGGAEIFRVHDVRPNLEALRMAEAILEAGPAG